jgi:trehalose utilization protein
MNAPASPLDCDRAIPSLSRRAWLGRSFAAAAVAAVPVGLLAAETRRVVVWSEGTAPEDKVYPQDINTAIAKGIKNFTLPQIERYSEPYAVPTPESVPLAGTYIYPDGKEEPTRLGLCWTVGKGRMFYFAPGHETYRDYYMGEVQRIFANAVELAAPGRD